MRIKLTAILVGVFAGLGLLLAVQAPAEAAPLPGGVVGTGSGGSCTASALHTRLAGGGLVTFNCGGPATIVLPATEVISLNTTIQGGGVITLSGGGAGLLDIEGGVVSVSGLTFTHGSATTGGAINNNLGRLTVSDSRFISNSAVSAGGAILSNVALTVTHSDFYSNTAVNSGGALYAIATLVVTDSTFNFNHATDGGAILFNTTAGRSGPAVITDQFLLDGGHFFSNTAPAGRGGAVLNFGTAAIRNSEFASNLSPRGGAVHNALDAVLTVQHSRFVSNTANGGNGGGILNLGQLAVDTSTFSGNQTLSSGFGGGLAQAASGEGLVTNSVFTGNVSLAGGGLAISGTLTLRNTTLTSNGAFGGGALLVDAGALTVTLTNNTLADNGALSGAALYNNGASGVLLKNNILSGQAGNNCVGLLTSLGHNLSDDHTCGLTASGDLTDTAPLLGPLADNGGPTLTRALLPGSPALNAGDNNGCPATDQRGFLRLGQCDIGAFELAYRLLLPLVRR